MPQKKETNQTTKRNESLGSLVITEEEDSDNSESESFETSEESEEETSILSRGEINEMTVEIVDKMLKA